LHLALSGLACMGCDSRASSSPGLCDRAVTIPGSQVVTAF
jgi:hypothetical protein